MAPFDEVTRDYPTAPLKADPDGEYYFRLVGNDNWWVSQSPYYRLELRKRRKWWFDKVIEWTVIPKAEMSTYQFGWSVAYLFYKVGEFTFKEFMKALDVLDARYPQK